jgi:hypothetical protein
MIGMSVLPAIDEPPLEPFARQDAPPGLRCPFLDGHGHATQAEGQERAELPGHR